MGSSKPDFAQKLLHDLRLRRERMAGTQTSDAFKGSSKEIFKPSQGSKTIVQTVSQKNGSAQRGFSSSHTPAQQSVNQIVPYGGAHRSAEKGDLSMAIAYSFDNGGNLKAFELQSNAAMVNLLQQISKRSMQHSSDIQQWQSANQFPTLTHLHVDEVARGTKKLNQILKACASGLNIENGSIEVGKELWKGAMDLEQSLRMLVSLQEASSDVIIKPQRKSRLKLLEEGEDCDDDNSITIAKQKQVERPIFSFDRTSRKTKGSAKTDVQQTTQVQNGDHTDKPENGSMISKGSHRRSASCGSEFQSQHLVSPPKPKHTTPRLPNVIAKLMGLEEVPQNAVPNPGTEVRTWPTHRSGELVLRTSHETVRTESKKITAMTTDMQGLQEERAHITSSMNENCYYRTTLDPQKNTWKEERAKNSVRDAQEVICKVNELQHQMKQPSGKARNARNAGIEIGISDIAHKPGVRNAAEMLPRALEREKRSSEVPSNKKSMANHISVNQQKKKPDTQLQPDKLPTTEPQEKKLKTENITQKSLNNSQQRKKTAHRQKPNSIQTDANNSKKLQRQQNARKNKTDGGCAASNASLSSKQTNDPVTEDASTNLELNEKSSSSLKPAQSVPPTDNETDSKTCTSLTTDAKSASSTKQKVEAAAEQTAQRRKHTVNNVKTKEIMAKTIYSPSKAVLRQKPLKPILHRQKPKKLEELIVPGRAAKQSEITSKRIQPITQPSVSPKHEETLEAMSEQTDTTNKPNGKESYSLPNELPPSNKSEFTTRTVPGSPQGQQLVADNDHESKPQKVATDLPGVADGYKDGACTYHALLQEQQRHLASVKQEPLTEDEINLKQKLIQSHLFLNTAAALFKLHIPIGLLNYASDQINNDKYSNPILDCGYELLKKKGRRKEMSLYPNISKVIKCTEVTTLDNLVRQMHKDFETLQSYGRSKKEEEIDEVQYLLNMLERDIFYTTPDLNCMWDLGWNDKVFAYTEADEVTKDVEQSLLDDLLGDIVSDWF